MRQLLVTCLLALIPWGAQAQTPSLQSGETLRGHFVQERHMQGFAKPVRSSGSFVLSPGRGLIWQAETPFAVTTIISPKGLTQRVNGKDVTKMAVAKMPFLDRLYSMIGTALAGDWGALDSGFTVKREGTGASTTVTLIPKDTSGFSAAAIQSIVAMVSQAVDTVDIVKPGGDFDHLIFTDQVRSTANLSPEETALLDGAGQ